MEKTYCVICGWRDVHGNEDGAPTEWKFESKSEALAFYESIDLERIFRTVDMTATCGVKKGHSISKELAVEDEDDILETIEYDFVSAEDVAKIDGVLRFDKANGEVNYDDGVFSCRGLFDTLMDLDDMVMSLGQSLPQLLDEQKAEEIIIEGAKLMDMEVDPKEVHTKLLALAFAGRMS